MREQKRERALLELRNALIDKEWVISCANMELERGGWTCDWNEAMRLCDEKVGKCLLALDDLDEQQDMF